jgi:hypothetical protein
MNNKFKGALLIVTGLCSIIFMFNFDRLTGKPADFGWCAAVAYLVGITAIINGVRIYIRK